MSKSRLHTSLASDFCIIFYKLIQPYILIVVIIVVAVVDFVIAVVDEDVRVISLDPFFHGEVVIANSNCRQRNEDASLLELSICRLCLEQLTYR